MRVVAAATSAASWNGSKALTGGPERRIARSTPEKSAWKKASTPAASARCASRTKESARNGESARPADVRQSRLEGRYRVLSSVIGVSRGAGGGPAPVSGEVVTASFRWCPRGGGGTGSAPAGFGRRRRAAAGARGRPRGG